MAISKISENDFITLVIKKIIKNSEWQYSALYREKVKTGKSSIDGRKIKFYGLYKSDFCETSWKKVQMRIRKILKFMYGDMYFLHISEKRAYVFTFHIYRKMENK